MARVTLIERGKATPEAYDLFRRIEKNGARVVNVYRAIAHTPAAASSFLKLGNCLLNETELSPALREIAILRIANLAGSEYEWAQHMAIAAETGVRRQQIDDIHRWTQSPHFTRQERAVLQYTDEVTRNVKVSDNTFHALREHLPERQIVELTMSIGYWGMIARVLVPLEIELDDQPMGSAIDLGGRGPRN